MQAFLKIMTLSIRQQLTYRTALLAGLATNLFFAFLRVALLKALYGGRAEVNGMTIEAAVTYVAISQGLIAFLYIFGSWEVMTTVYTGSIGADLLKPFHLLMYWMARDLGRAVVNLVARGIVLAVAFAFFFSIALPSSASQWLGFSLAMLLGWLVSFAWRFLVNLAAFWTPDARGIGRLAFTASQLFSGFLLPLRLYPDWFSRLCSLTPFPALLNTTSEVFLGILNGRELMVALLNQAAWIVILFGACLLALRVGVKRLVIQGG